ncbi:MAG: CAP domain-containing protein [Acidobacteria bacterium]|nr:CAP domain-containing protein [Acidobacteriota bacterium]
MERKTEALKQFNGAPPASVPAVRRRDLMLRIALLCGATLFTPLPGVAATPTAMIPPTPNVGERYLLNAANNERIARGLPMLHNDPVLAQAARYHALQMAEHRDISHQFDGEPDLTERGANAGVRFSLITENVAEASDSVIIHSLWMHSPGHRENLLDPEVDSVGIAVVSRGGQVYAVEDFASTVELMSFSDQEQAVADTLSRSGLTVGSSDHTSTLEDARQTCSMQSGYAGQQNHPWYIVRYTADRLDQIPDLLAKRIGTNKYHKAVVGACTDTYSGPFSAYNIAVLLYP